MDPGSRSASALTTDPSALSRLTQETRTDFPNLTSARAKTSKALEGVQGSFAAVERDDDTAVVLMGSWGRHELTSGSDNDFVVLVDGPQEFSRTGLAPRLEVVREVLSRHGGDPGREGVFATYVYSDHLVGRIGLDQDDNKNLTRRMLLVLESVPVAGHEVQVEIRRRVIEGYLEKPVKEQQPPRFFLNDLVRYWRTICVDFVGKQRLREGEGWGLRNAKLRLTRKALFASGLLPILRCSTLSSTEVAAFLTEQFKMVPTDRLADAFVALGQADAGARALKAYDDFLGLLDDGQTRKQLDEAQRAELKEIGLWKEVQLLGDTLQAALLTLLFDTRQLEHVVREYAVF